MQHAIRILILSLLVAPLMLLPSARADDFSTLLAKGPPPLKACLQKTIDRDQAAYLWQILTRVNGQHQRLFELYAATPPQHIPATTYGKVFPYRYSCSELEKILFYCLDRFQKEKTALVGAQLPNTEIKSVKVKASAKHPAPKPLMTGAVRQLMFRMLILADRIRMADCQLIHGKVLSPDEAWPQLPMDKMDAPSAVALLIQKLEIICRDNQLIIEKF